MRGNDYRNFVNGQRRLIKEREDHAKELLRKYKSTGNEHFKRLAITVLRGANSTRAFLKKLEASR